MLTEEELVTIDSYNRIASQWASTHMDPRMCAEEFETFRKYVPNGTILEVGVGGGRDAIKFRASSYKYLGIDVSDGLIEVARSNVPGARFINHDICDPNLGVSFDGVWCVATLIHLPKTQLPKALDGIHKTIRPGGTAFICMKEGEGDMVLENEGPDIKRYFSYYKQGEFSKHLEQTGFTILPETNTKQVSRRTTWLNYFVQTKK